MSGLARIALAGIAAVFIAPPAVAEGLQRTDMATLPLAEITLQGGSFSASLFEDNRPWKSQLLAECQNCAQYTSALVGLRQDVDTEAQDFLRNPQNFLMEMQAICRQQAEGCNFSQSTVGGLPGYAYTARYPDGFHIVEHVYYSNGLVFLINASSPDLNTAKANVATLIRVAGPYVTGQKP